MPEKSQKETDATLNLLYEIGRVLASAETMREAAPQILAAICENLNFELGELWRVDAEEKFLKLENFWHLPLTELESFTARSHQFAFPSGTGLPGKVWAANAPVWIENISREESMPRKSFIEDIAMQSAVAFPIRLGDKLLGVFTFFCRESCPHDEDLLKMFVVVGNHVGQFIEREQIERNLRESENRYRAFVRQSTEGIWRFELDEKIPVNLTVDEQVKMAFKFGYLAECNDAMAQIYGLEKARELVGSRLSDLLDKNDAVNMEYLRAFFESGCNIADGESRGKDADGKDKFFLNSLVGSIEGEFLIRVWGTRRDITRRKQAEQSLLERARLALLNSDVNRALVQNVSLADILRSCTNAIIKHLDGAFARIWTLNEKENALELQASSGIYTHLNGEHSRVPIGKFKIGRIAEERRPHLTNSVVGDERVSNQEWAKREKMAAFAGYPLIVEKRLVGVVAMFARQTLNEQTLDALASVANVIALGIERKSGEERIRESEANLRRLAEISELIRKSEDADELLFIVSKAIGEHLEVRRCLFNEIDLEQDRETVYRDFCRGVESVAGVHRISDYSPITSAEMIAGKTVVNEDSKIDSRTAPDYAKTYEASGERAYVAVPLLRDNRWVASLWVSDDEPRQWKQQEISLLETVAERTWMAIEKLRINNALRESEERYRSLFETIDEGFCLCEMIFDADGKPFDYCFLETNPAFERMTGLEKAEGKTARELIPNLEKHWFKIYGQVISTGEAIRFVDGSEAMNRWFDVYASRVGGEASRKFALLITNITERKRAEAEREQLLESEQQARQIAEHANHAKDEFIAVVSHELRSPLNAMLGWTRILQKQKADEKTVEYALDVIVRNARAQSKLIEDLLDIARVGEKKLRLDLHPIELAPIISHAVEVIKPAATAKNIRISQTLDRAANFIVGDDDRLRQTVENLLSNAVKFTPDGGQVNINLERERNAVKIIVSDNGQGIPAEFLPQIFERFKQADLSTTRRHGGLGIGLSLAQDLVELHGGTIVAESAGEGKGATFIVRLPLLTVAAIKENSSKVKFMDSQGKLSGFWILAVDDEADAREIVSFMLQINGAKVTTANSSVEALDILKNSNGRLPDILLSDISMPNESGYALLEKIRALPEENGGQIPAVALTAFNRPEDRQSAFDAGFQKHLGKPVEMDDLISAIIETVNSHQLSVNK